jgi:8-oxo-dGTP pyrophosphatase MutT (NUDIX family)
VDAAAGLTGDRGLPPSRRAYRQRVPRPAGAAVVERAAFWAGREGEVGRLGIEEVRARLASPLSDGPSERPEAAVLVALVARSGGPAVVLIRRAAHLRENAGEVALPGGRLEPGEGAREGALREAEEEVGLPPEAVEVIGALEPRRRASGPPLVVPVVGLVAPSACLVANPAEVAEILYPRVADLVRPSAYWQELWPGFARAGAPRRASVEAAEDALLPFFALGEDVVWGLTARVLEDLLVRLARSPGEPSPTRDAPSAHRGRGGSGGAGAGG